METRNEQVLPLVQDRMKQLNKELRWMRLWNWPGWIPLVAVLQFMALLILFLWSGPLLRMIDPSVSVIDAGALSPAMLALVIVDGCALSAWGVVHLVRERLTGFYDWDEEQGDVINKLPVCLAAKIIAGIFFGLVLLSVLVFTVLL
ncbi:hypothetical protein SAMN05216436_11990 [bacterium A37T11]|nr:hypothetical protein SAMN05216436_11990 [bacterium A37T11]